MISELSDAAGWRMALEAAHRRRGGTGVPLHLLNVTEAPMSFPEFTPVLVWYRLHAGPVEALAYRVTITLAEWMREGRQIDVAILAVAKMEKALDEINAELVKRTPHAPGLLDDVFTDYPKSLGRP